jgi:hypothetical protein
MSLIIDLEIDKRNKEGHLLRAQAMDKMSEWMLFLAKSLEEKYTELSADFPTGTKDRASKIEKFMNFFASMYWGDTQTTPTTFKAKEDFAKHHGAQCLKVHYDALMDRLKNIANSPLSVSLELPPYTAVGAPPTPGTKG